MLRFTLCFLISLFVAFANSKIPIPSTRQIEPRADDSIYRLPNSTRPEAYVIDINTNIHNGTFEFGGLVAIDLEVLEATSSIILHQRQLSIASLTLETNPANGMTINVLPFTYDVITEFLNITVTNEPLTVGGKYTLKIVYSGMLRTDEAGFYRSSYIADDLSRRWLATTQFESTDARHGFPCYDEPAFRANFTINIRHDASYHAISNMPVNGVPSSNGDGTVTTRFQTTPKTPTYLIAYIVSDFARRDNAINTQSFPHATYARPNAIHGADYSVYMAEEILRSFDQHLTINFSHALPKMDQVAVPDFAAGAMENWGLVTYREPYLLWFENSTFTTKTNIVTIIAHEFAHQWFGNLVTPEWWTYIWLNEGFATLYEHYATEWVLPEWKILDHFVYATLQNVFQNDARSETRPMSHYVENPDDIDMLFDSVAYDKSGSVLRMMLHALGETTFTKGLVYYLKAKEFSYASENDLFAALNQASREDNAISTSQSISLIMSSWTRQKGFPVVQVTRNYQTGTINLRQEKYLTVPSPDQDPALWWIPYNFATNNHSDFSNTKAENWIPGTRTATVNPTSSKTWESTDWIIFNKQETGYYRVLYDVQNYNLIINQLRDDFSKIHLTSRAQLIDDAFDFARTRRLDYGVAFDIAAHLERDIEYVPWGSFLRGLTLVNRMLVASSEYPRFQNFTRILIKHLYDNVGLTDKGDNEPHFQKQARIWAINWACTMNSEECLRDTALAMTQSVHVNVKQTIFCNGLRSASTSDYVNVFTLLTSATDPNDRNRFISALGCSRNRTHLMDYINTSDASSEENIYISQAERYRVFTSVLDNGQVGLQVAIEFLQNELAVAASAYGKNNINNALIAVATYITTTEMENEFLKVLGAAPGVNLIEPTTIVRAVQIIADNKAWLTAHKTSVENWVTEFHRSREDGENNNNGATTITLSALVIPFIMIIKLL